MQGRIRYLAMAWLLCGAFILIRVATVMLTPDVWLSAHGPTWPYPVIVTADMEHLLLRQTDDGRGRILFRNRQPWSVSVYNTRNREAAIVSQQSRVQSKLQHGKVTLVPNSASAVGMIGKPDKWPDRDRVVPEQGRSGLEYTFDRILSSRRPGLMGYLQDARGQKSQHVFQVQPERGSDVRTTIDFAWQKTAEQLLTRYGIHQGAVVVLDTRSNEVLAMASRDVTHPTNVVAVRAFTPGSVFKLVTAAAAYETYEVQPDDLFYCNGWLHTPQVNMHCWRPHGYERFEDAIAESCDVVLATVGIHVGPAAVQEVARRFGLAGTTGLQTIHGTPVLSEAESGVIYRISNADAGLLANSAIGQQDVRLSPLQAANMASTIANQGVYREARLVCDIESPGGVSEAYRIRRGTRAVTWMTSAKVARAMRLAVVSTRGTAHALSRSGVDVAAKTGTAELKNNHVNGWMVGFAPYDKPEIAFCVFDGDVTSKAAHRDVPEIVHDLLRAYKQFHCPPIIK